MFWGFITSLISNISHDYTQKEQGRISYMFNWVLNTPLQRANDKKEKYLYRTNFELAEVIKIFLYSTKASKTKSTKTKAKDC